jgi:UDP-4-amino-4,6-dideoxy-N-acetyl-beta-L-altrosamine transaminase
MHKNAERVAICTGQPVRETVLPYGHQQIDEEDINAVVEVLRSDWITTGPKVVEFEEAFAAYVHAKYAVSFSSGTAALHGAAFTAGLGSGDEAITTPMTFCATANCVLYQGATPVFVDICADTLNIDPNEVQRRITSKTKAILPVDYAGHPTDLDEILDLAEHHGLVVIEDACHALGAEYKTRYIGSISHMTVFSFHPVKHITTGEGGMVTTNNAEFARRLRIFRNHGIDSDPRQRQVEGQWHYEMVALGYNYRLTDIGCALGLSQLKRLPENVARRREIASLYTEAFNAIPTITTPAVRPDVNPAWHLYPLRLDLKNLRVGRAEIFHGLRDAGLGVNVHYIPVHFQPYYRNRFDFTAREFPIAETAYDSLISLPIFHGMTDRNAQEVISTVQTIAEHYAA